MTSTQKDRICDGIETKMMIENYQRQGQNKSSGSTSKSQTTNEFHDNNHNGYCETVQVRRSDKGMNNGNNVNYRQNSRTFSNSNHDNNVKINGRQQQ